MAREYNYNEVRPQPGEPADAWDEVPPPQRLGRPNFPPAPLGYGWRAPLPFEEGFDYTANRHLMNRDYRDPANGPEEAVVNFHRQAQQRAFDANIPFLFAPMWQPPPQ